MEITEKSLKNILTEQREFYQEYTDKTLVKQREEFQEHVDKKLVEQREEYQRYIGVVSEEFHHRVDAIGEQYSGIKETLDSHTEMIVALKEDMEIVKTDVEFIKGALKKKVDYEEFEALEKRLTILESKMHHLKQNHA